MPAGPAPERDFEAYFPDDLLVSLADGSLDLNATADVSRGKDGWVGTFGGDAGLRNFHALGSADEDLLKWESLQLDGISGTLNPPSVRLQGVALNNFFVKILVDGDGQPNLRNLRQTPEKKGPTVEAPPPVVAAAPPAGPAPAAGTHVTIDAVVLQDGTVSDIHLPRHYESTMVNLGGRVTGLSSEESRVADVDLRGTWRTILRCG